MKDIYRELLRRSVEDANEVRRTVNEDHEDIELTGDFIAEASMNLYRHRVQAQRQKVLEAKAGQTPDSDDRGRY